jgi:DNA-directed RNA polymerase specialized sigma24 family protein
MYLRFFNDMPTREIAEFLGITENNIYGIIRRARAHMLQDLMQRKWIDADEKPAAI